ncbi:response regulator transcription factor [Cryptosporangium sp. NPDC051539]|uniref:response regulator transcription factor n=1 Tax=Cryptosporangium sp. NPDC051539 TaxID=3363962 RepID=UPI0037B47E66
MARILVIDADQNTAGELARRLRDADHHVDHATDGLDGLRRLFRARPDLVLLDLSLNGLDGWQVLGRIRDLTDVPVLILTAHRRESDKVRALHSGADDYVTKPFATGEVLARVTALLRRTRTVHWSAEIYRDDRLLIDPAGRSVQIDGSPVDLTALEFRLLQMLARHRGAVLTTAQLLDRVWDDPTGVGPERVKFAVLRLRRRLGWSDRADSPIQSVRGVGYRYRPAPVSAASASVAA